jgi:hypothetical protein
MRTILIAEEGERTLVEQYLPGETNIIVTGVGALNIIRSLRDLPRDTELINIGYAGSANYAIGTLVEVTECRLHHPNVTYDEPVMPLQPIDDLFVRALQPVKAVCYSNTDFVLASPYKDCVFDMESAYIAALGFTHLSALKIVSDNLSLHAYHELTHGVE